jgi:23S rRNA (adenine2030-N6)-methyltransferase
MNYRHAFHAGNHADVFKHIILCRILFLMQRKPKPFAFVDVHAGMGAYDLLGVESSKTMEWMSGVAKMAAPFSVDVENLLTPYRKVLRSVNSTRHIRRYPGSPTLAAALLRSCDRMYFNELHEPTQKAVKAQFSHDSRVTVTQKDANHAIAALLPVNESRAVILIDPAYELADERQRVLRMLSEGLMRMADATFMVWYPIKIAKENAAFTTELSSSSFTNCLTMEIRTREQSETGGLAGSGLAIINPPWRLAEEANVLVPAIAARLGIGDWGRGAVTWLKPPA